MTDQVGQVLHEDGDPGPVKVLVCAMNEEGKVVASLRVDPIDAVVETARGVMLAVSPVVQNHLVHARPRG